ncbi:unnamed protein product [Effrenium voratum]|uniref:Uncharacterized protein n=1 Tax=Effrenium voratum TaxID=2562239 RepID=A0AA36HWI8_9DINO|nr:unnamed protein product [Effrenium voratum]
MVLRRLAACCCGSEEDPDVPVPRRVRKPILPLDRVPAAPAKTLEELAKRFDLQLAPPGSETPVAVASKSFERNSSRLLLVLPGPGDAGVWDAHLGEHGSTEPMLMWAEANDYACAYFGHEAFCTSPVEAWDRVVRGSPARFVTVVVGAGMLQYLQQALKNVHPLLFSRFRTICVFGSDTTEDFDSLPQELRSHFKASIVTVPFTWQKLELQVAYQFLHELFRDKEDMWHTLELKKFAGFQALKENDLPGLRRIGLDERVKRLDRDRNNDELAQLLQKHEEARRKPEAKIDNSDDEPGVD